MNRWIAAACSLFVLTASVSAESKNFSDYPLRIHIFSKSQTTFYHNHYVDEAKGDGRANLFANGEVHGIEFTYSCSEKLKSSFGYETYGAKWKKPNQELTVLLPVYGKAGSFFTCNLKTDVKDFAFTSHNGRIASESPAAFKAWMMKHDYDPEHGKNMPVKNTDAADANHEPEHETP